MVNYVNHNMNFHQESGKNLMFISATTLFKRTWAYQLVTLVVKNIKNNFFQHQIGIFIMNRFELFSGYFHPLHNII